MIIGDLIILSSLIILSGAIGSWTVGICKNPTYKKAIIAALLSMLCCYFFIWLSYSNPSKFLDIIVY